MPLPRDAQAFNYACDPGDQLDYSLDFAALLGSDDQISAPTLQVAPSAEAAAYGLQVLGGELAPVVTAGGQAIVFWLTVDPARRADGTWQGFGRDLDINVNFDTTSDPPRHYDRDVAINVRNR